MNERRRGKGRERRKGKCEGLVYAAVYLQEKFGISPEAGFGSFTITKWVPPVCYYLTAEIPPSAPPPSHPSPPSPPSTELQRRPVPGRAAAHGFPRVLDFWRQEPAPPRTPWTARLQRARPPRRHARGGSRDGWRDLDRRVSGGGALKAAPAVGDAMSTGAAERRVRGGGGLVELGLDAGPQGPDGGGARGRRWRLPWP